MRSHGIIERFEASRVANLTATVGKEEKTLARHGRLQFDKGSQSSYNLAITNHRLQRELNRQSPKEEIQAQAKNNPRRASAENRLEKAQQNRMRQRRDEVEVPKSSIRVSVVERTKNAVRHRAGIQEIDYPA